MLIDHAKVPPILYQHTLLQFLPCSVNWCVYGQDQTTENWSQVTSTTCEHSIENWNQGYTAIFTAAELVTPQTVHQACSQIISIIMYIKL